MAAYFPPKNAPKPVPAAKGSAIRGTRFPWARARNITEEDTGASRYNFTIVISSPRKAITKGCKYTVSNKILHHEDGVKSYALVCIKRNVRAKHERYCDRRTVTMTNITDPWGQAPLQAKWKRETLHGEFEGPM